LTALAGVTWVAFATLAAAAGALLHVFSVFISMDIGGGGLPVWYPILFVVVPLLFAVGLFRRSLAAAILATGYGASLAILLLLGTRDPAYGAIGLIPGGLAALAAQDIFRHDRGPLG
jgi:hypothetical protein